MKKIVYVLLTIALSLVALDAKSYKYDDLDRVIEVRYESGEKIFYSYDSAGNMTYAGMDEYQEDDSEEQYHLNDISVTDPLIIDKIKLAIGGLEEAKIALDELENYDGDKLRQEYDGIKKLLDDSKKLMDDVKQSIDNSNPDESLKKEADNIKKAIDDVKKLIDGYKKDGDNSPEAIEDIKDDIDSVIAMMRSGKSSEDVETTSISIKQGRNTISGNIDITTLPDEIHSIWIVDGGNWYGYSPHPTVRDEIEDKYLLIEGSVANSKGIIVFAMNDTYIESINGVDDDVEHTYSLGYTLHGTNGESMSASDVVCDDSNSLVMMAIVRNDEASVYVPKREIDDMENFEYLDGDDGYFVLCDKDKR